MLLKEFGMLDAKILGERIKELRKQRGLTQSAFADDMSVSFQAVSNWERGIAPPDLDNLNRNQGLARHGLRWGKVRLL